MNGKYKGIGGKSVAGLLLCLIGVLTACEDDFGKNGTNSGVLTMKVEVPEGWTSGVAVDEEAPDSRCVSVDAAASESSIPLYLHTIESDNTVAVPSTRGELKTEVKKFSMSAICYEEEEGTYGIPNLTPNFAYDLTCTVGSDGTVSCPERLLWPANGNVRFFAFAQDANSSEPLFTLSDAKKTGTPTITYIVPEDITKQHDLMAACTDATSSTVDLNFRHILTAVKIVTAKDMLPGEITKVEFFGIPNQGTYTPSTDAAKDNWKIDETSTGTYTVERNVIVDGSYTMDTDGNIDVANKENGTSKEVIGLTDDLTLLMIPQTLPAGATLEVKFKEALSGHEYTLSADLGGKEWPAGKIVTYSISPSSIHIKAEITFDSNTIPYSGVWYEYAYKARINVTQKDVTKAIDIPAEKIQFQYQMKKDGATDWKNCEEKGLVIIDAQPAYTTMKNTFSDRSEKGTETGPFSLPSEYGGETANCYLIDRPGYYSLPLVYGNGYTKLNPLSINSFTHYPKHDEGVMPADGKISGAHDAVLCWQDAPDLIDPTSVKVVDKDKLVFRIRKQTLTQGNALLAVRNEAKEILWSWHIWVTPYKQDFYKATANTLAKYNLGWCDRHKDNNAERKFALQAVIDMSVYGGNIEKVELGEFTQMEFKGSEAGDNTYYQWGRKDPMLGGIYNSTTPKYKYERKGNKAEIKTDEFNMENKQVFNQYNQDGCNYSFCKNPGDMVALKDGASDGVTIGYTIKHPYMFITNSRSAPSDGNTGYPDYEPKFQFRNNWHLPNNDSRVTYLQGGKKFYNAWDADATDVNVVNAVVRKTVYDPCPPKFKVPNVDAFKTITSSSYDSKKHAWNVTINGNEYEIPITGMRDYALRRSEWKTVVVASGTVPGFNCEDFYKISMPAFYNSSFVSSATLESKDATKDGYETGDHVKILNVGTASLSYVTSSNSYGLTVRPMKEPN